jgi:hypothetical protein
METMFLGLPIGTAALFTGIPVLIIGLLVWWGISYKPKEDAGSSDMKEGE